MPSSISSSDVGAAAQGGSGMASAAAGSESIAALRRTTSFERLTAADRPGVAQPVPERPVPSKPWGAIMLRVVILLVLAVAAWEWRLRAHAMLPGDLRDGPSYWAEERRKLDAGNVPVAIVGDSRLLFDTDLARFEALTGVRPVQLALPGTNGRPFLENVAADEDFKGLLLVGVTDLAYFRKEIGLMADALGRYEFESPAQRSSFLLHRALSRQVGFLDEAYRLSRLVQRLDHGTRAGAVSPYDGVWKVSTIGEARQTFLWSRIETDPYLNGHARHFWSVGFRRPPPDAATIAMTLERTRTAVTLLRAHGADVVFVRPPSTAAYAANEKIKLPRAKGWDALLAAADAQGIHADDHPAMDALYLPEWSHLSRACATVFTDMYVRALVQLTPRVALLPDAPAPLSPNDCRPPPNALPE